MSHSCDGPLRRRLRAPPGSPAARNNPVTKRCDFGHSIRLRGDFIALAVPRLFTQTIIRGAQRSRLSIAISVAIVSVAVVVLFHLLRGIDLGKVIIALEAEPRSRILVSAALVVAGYTNLVGYDLFALYSIGKRDIPLRVVAFTSFTSYTIGHSLGAATLTCGLVRYRVYSFWRMTLLDVAKIALFTGMTYWLGNIAVLGGAAVYAPHAFTAIDQMPALPNRLIGLAGILAIVCYLLWLGSGRRLVGRDNWQVLLPGVRGTVLQIAIGTLDRILASLSIYMLLPANPEVGFATVLVVFVIATLLGIVSHAPGSLGVVEAAFLVGLPQYPREDLVAALVIFRIIDFFLPLTLAILLFAARELRLLMRRSSTSQIDPRTDVSFTQ